MRQNIDFDKSTCLLQCLVVEPKVSDPLQANPAVEHS